jgi:PadR family transcriptional regulator, regulatory protein PadR
MSDISEQTDKLRQELRRGIVVLAVLSQLHTNQYGYSLIQQLAGKGFDIEEGTLYPLLRRLEEQGLLKSEWEVTESRPRKYYRISENGREILRILSAEWQQTVNIMNHLLGGEQHD